MNRTTTTGFAAVAAALMVAGCMTGGSEDIGQSSSEVQSELQGVRQATAAYHDIDAALDDGFVDSGLPCVPGQGYHYLNPGRLGTVEADKPELLLYEQQEDGSMVLVGVEYLFPIDDPDNPPPAPELFGQHYHGPTTVEGVPFYFYALHGWIWQYNNDGVFADSNDKVTCP